MDNKKFSFENLVNYFYKHRDFFIIFWPYLLFNLIFILSIMYLSTNYIITFILNHKLLVVIWCIMLIKVFFHILLEHKIGFNQLGAKIQLWSDKNKTRLMLVIQLINLEFLFNYIFTNYFYRVHSWVEVQDWKIITFIKLLNILFNLILMPLLIMYYNVLKNFKLSLLNKFNIYSSTGVFLSIWIFYLGSPIILIIVGYVVIMCHLFIITLIKVLLKINENLDEFVDYNFKLNFFIDSFYFNLFGNYGAQFYNGDLFDQLHHDTSYFITFFNEYILDTFKIQPKFINHEFTSENIFELGDIHEIFLSKPILHMRYISWDVYDLKGLEHFKFKDWEKFNKEYLSLNYSDRIIFLNKLKNLCLK